jgi:hypothetical protein
MKRAGIELVGRSHLKKNLTHNKYLPIDIQLIGIGENQWLRLPSMTANTRRKRA